MTSYRTIAAPVEATIEEKRSVFECWLRRVDDEAAAREVVEEARSRHWDARHHCSAFRLGPDGAIARSNDDGEPSGTAGAPMLEVLQGSGLSDVVAVVTRWFGGTLLGAGGLVRAYSDAVRAAVAQAREIERGLVRLVDVRTGHDLAGRLEHDLRARGIGIEEVAYAELVTLRVQVPVAEASGLSELVAELTSGRGEVDGASSQDRWVDLGEP